MAIGLSSRRRGAHRAALGVGAALAFALCGCSESPSIEAYAHVRAQLDTDSETIAMPLDAYATSQRSVRLIEHANAVVTAKCMAEAGQPYPRANVAWESLPPRPDLLYGRFSLASAEKFGYFPPDPPETEEVSRVEGNMPQAWWDAIMTCSKTAKDIPLGILNSTSIPTPADEALRVTYEQATATAGWKAAVADWTSCIKKFGLVPDDDFGVTPKLPKGDEAQLRAAVSDVSCKQQTNFVQRVADIHARYEAAYIDAHQAQLNQLRDEVNANVARAKKIIATHGG